MYTLFMTIQTLFCFEFVITTNTRINKLLTLYSKCEAHDVLGMTEHDLVCRRNDIAPVVINLFYKVNLGNVS